MAKANSRSEKSEISIENQSQSNPIESFPAEAKGQSVEVMPKRQKRRFSAKAKLRILTAAEACSKPGEVGALLRREGLYSSQLTRWKRLQGQGELGALTDKKRGPKAVINPMKGKLAAAEKEVAALMRRLEKAEEIIDVQKKFAALFGKIMALPSHLEDK